MNRDRLIRRHKAKTKQAGPDECWLWRGSFYPNGYGRMGGGKHGHYILATHIALEADGRPRVDGLLALHHCDNPACQNPRHLYWGTHHDNMLDREKRGRISKEHYRRGYAAGLEKWWSRQPSGLRDEYLARGRLGRQRTTAKGMNIGD